MIVKMIWGKCEYQNNSWGNEPVDSFFVMCMTEEVEKEIILLIPIGNLEIFRMRTKALEKKLSIKTLIYVS